MNIWVPGIPRPKGSMRGFARGGRVLLVNDNPSTKPWQLQVAHCASLAWDGRLAYDGGVTVWMRFDMPRPKAHYNKQGAVKPFATDWCVRKPDVDKLARCVLDALTLAKVWTDDSRVHSLQAVKKYCGQQGPGLSLQVRFD